MEAQEIAKALTEAVIGRITYDQIAGPGLGTGKPEEFGKKVGELYKGILAEVINALKSEQPDRMKVQKY